MSDSIDANDFRRQAKELKENNKYLDAVELYKKIYYPNCDKWIAWEYTVCLKKISEIDDAIDIAKNTYFHYKNFQYNNNILSWLLYEKYFKCINDSYDYNDINNLLSIANFVSDITLQNKDSAYEHIMIQLLKILKQYGNNPMQKILDILGKLDVNKLSDEANKYEKDGREQEYQSRKEMYYSLKTKSLLDLEKYDECIKCCDEAVNKILIFHHDNDIWIKSRKAICLSNIGEIDLAIVELENLIVKKNHWTLYAEIARIYLLKDDKNNALYYFCRAAITLDSAKMKVTLYFEIANLLYSMGELECAWIHLSFAKNIREKEGWRIPHELQTMSYELSNYSYINEVKLSDLIRIWLDVIYKTIGKQQGIVTHINKGGKTGFIKSEHESYFFKISSVIGKRHIKENDKVSFALIQSYDIKKQQKSVECAYIVIDESRKIL